MNRHVSINLNPMSVPPIADRVNRVHEYAGHYLRHACDHYTLREYVEQIILDEKDRSIGLELKAEIRRLQRLGRGGY